MVAGAVGVAGSAVAVVAEPTVQRGLAGTGMEEALVSYDCFIFVSQLRQLDQPEHFSVAPAQPELQSDQPPAPKPPSAAFPLGFCTPLCFFLPHAQFSLSNSIPQQASP